MMDRYGEYKSKRKLMIRCRSCSNYFNKIKGLQWMDGGCCSQECYVKAGPSISPPVIFQADNHKISRKEKKNKINKMKKEKHQKHPFYDSKEWLALRFDTLKKYGRECMLCHRTKSSMHVDHIIPRSKCPEKALDPDNLQVLCRECNIGKSNRDSTDFRPVNPYVKPLLQFIFLYGKLNLGR